MAATGATGATGSTTGGAVVTATGGVVGASTFFVGVATGSSLGGGDVFWSGFFIALASAFGRLVIFIAAFEVG